MEIDRANIGFPIFDSDCHDELRVSMVGCHAEAEFDSVVEIGKWLRYFLDLEVIIEIEKSMEIAA